VRGMTRSAKGTAQAPGSNVAQQAGLNRGILAGQTVDTHSLRTVGKGEVGEIPYR
jgi:putative transposase